MGFQQWFRLRRLAGIFVSSLGLELLLLPSDPLPFAFPPLDLQRAIFFDKIKSVIGESCLRSRFRAAESSVRMLRAFAIKVSNGGYADCSKKKIPGARD